MSQYFYERCFKVVLSIMIPKRRPYSATMIQEKNTHMDTSRQPLPREISKYHTPSYSGSLSYHIWAIHIFFILPSTYICFTDL